MSEHKYDEIIRRRKELENQAQAAQLILTAMRDKLQADCPHIETKADDCVLCGKTLRERTKLNLPFGFSQMFGIPRDASE